MSSGARRGQVAVVGVGHSKVYRRSDVVLAQLAVDAARIAIEDAGLVPGDIDGITSASHVPYWGGGNLDGVDEVSAGLIVSALDLRVGWIDKSQPSITGSLQSAILAVAGGATDYALVVRAMHSPHGRYGAIAPTTATGPMQFSAPYGDVNAAPFAFLMRRYMETYGAGREQMAAFVVRNRQQALKWEHGYWYQHRPEELTVDEYMNARMIAEPLCLLDCDLPVQGAGAFVVTTADRARDLRNPPSYVLGLTSGGANRVTQGHLDDYMAAGTRLADRLWNRSGVGPGDVDVLDVYDGYSILAPLWIEAAGFCERGGAFDFVESPPMPLNTASGNLGGGRMHGVAQLMEATLQVSGRSGIRQVPNAEIAAVLLSPHTMGGSGFVFGSEPAG